MGIRLKLRNHWTSSADAEPVLYEFEQERVAIGRGAGADVRLPHRAVSQNHASIQVESDRFTITDLGSTNGTRVNGEPLIAERPRHIRNGDVIELGGFSLRFEGSVIVAQATTWERTSALARQLVRDVMEATRTSLMVPTLTVTDGLPSGPTLEIGKDMPFLIGRGDHCHLVIEHADVSREHAEVWWRDDGVFLRDLGSKNGIVINKRGTRERRLRQGDIVEIGAVKLLFEDPADQLMEIIESEPDLVVDAPHETSHATIAAADHVVAQPELPEPSATTAPELPPTRKVRAVKGDPQNTVRSRFIISERLADLFIYALAGLVFVASVLGLMVLLSSD